VWEVYAHCVVLTTCTIGAHAGPVLLWYLAFFDFFPHLARRKLRFLRTTRGTDTKGVRRSMNSRGHETSSPRLERHVGQTVCRSELTEDAATEIKLLRRSLRKLEAGAG